MGQPQMGQPRMMGQPAPCAPGMKMGQPPVGQYQQQQQDPHMASAAAAAIPSNPCHAAAVRNFTRACAQPTPNQPELMSETEVDFITKMLLDEILELQATVATPARAKNKMIQMLQQ